MGSEEGKGTVTKSAGRGVEGERGGFTLASFPLPTGATTQRHEGSPLKLHHEGCCALGEMPPVLSLAVASGGIIALRRQPQGTAATSSSNHKQQQPPPAAASTGRSPGSQQLPEVRARGSGEVAEKMCNMVNTTINVERSAIIVLPAG